MDYDVLIVGGGPAGLATAFWHQRQNPHARVLVCEAAATSGGWVQSERRDGYLCENGPQAVRPNDDFYELVTALGIEAELVPAAAQASTRWIGRDGRLLAAPAGPLGLISTRLLSWRGKLRLLRERRVPAAGPGEPDEPARESVSDFCGRRFGAETVPLAQAMVGGVFAGDADRLEVDSAFPLLAELEQRHGSIFAGMKSRARERRQERRQQAANTGTKTVRRRPALLTLRSGMAALTRHLATAIGDALVCDTAIESVEQHDGRWSVVLADGTHHTTLHLVLACPARVSARLLANTAPLVADELAAIPFASLASVYLGLPCQRLPRTLRGFGFLLTRAPDNPVLGAIYASQIFPDHAPPGHTLLRVMMGGALHPETVDLDDQQLVTMATASVARHTGVTTQPTFSHVVRCRDAIPQYEHGHKARLQRIAARLGDLPGLELRGNSYRGVAVTAQLANQPIASAAAATTEGVHGR